MFNRPSVHPIILAIIGLACFGLLYRLVVNPLGLIKEILIAAVVIGIIFMIYKFVMQKKFGSATTQLNSKYKNAVRQSKKRYNDTSNHTPTVRGLSQKPLIKKPLRSVSTKNSKKRDHNFTVIDGKKGKKKNRAFF